MPACLVDGRTSAGALGMWFVDGTIAAASGVAAGGTRWRVGSEQSHELVLLHAATVVDAALPEHRLERLYRERCG
eukprot:917348-Prymnesium_polylepis.1